MATKRDQLQSHQFLVQRVVSALTTRETDPEQPPFRRPMGAAFGSIALAVLVLVGFGVYGLIVPGGKTAWRTGESVIVEKETGTRFVYVDGRLHPATNYVSALLALGKYAKPMNVSHSSLAGVPRGPRIGIPDAPDALPAPANLLGGAWSLCSEPMKDVTGAAVDESVLMVGHQPAGGRSMDDDALLVAVSETGDQYLLRGGYRHRIRPTDVVTVGLALRSEPWATVGLELIDAIPSGEALRPIQVEGLGQPSRAVAGMKSLRIGQLLVVESTGGGRQYYLVERDQLRPITPLQYDIQRTFAPTAKAYGGRQPVAAPLGLVAAGQARQAPAAPTTAGQLPAERPDFVAPRGPGTSLCAIFDPGAVVPRLMVDATMPARDPMTSTSARTGRGAPLADRVLVPPGQAAVVETMPAPDAPAGTIGLVTDLGIIHYLAGPKVLETLGYQGVTPIRMPAGLVARIPAGNGLDPAAAKQQLAGPATR
jgi:type VII secretion protein EccB